MGFYDLLGDTPARFTPSYARNTSDTFISTEASWRLGYSRPYIVTSVLMALVLPLIMIKVSSVSLDFYKTSH